jgi:two-component system NtrC family response regulator
MYRINTFEIVVPPLRQRLTDIPELARHLYARFRPAPKSSEDAFDPAALEALRLHSWPGNIRELSNVIEHATIVCDHPPILPEHLPARFGTRGARPGMIPPISLRDLEMHAIQQSLQRHQGDKPAVAEELGISLKTLYNKLSQTAALDKSA